MSTKAKISAKKGRKGQKIDRVPSNFFNTLDQSQIHTFNEAFKLIDQDKDGVISHDDLTTTLTSFGQNPTRHDVDEMLSENSSNKLTFTSYLSMFGSRMANTDPADVIRNAFRVLDDTGDGKVPAKFLKELLATMGNRMTDEDIRLLFKDIEIESDGNIDYLKFVRILKSGQAKPDDSDIQPEAEDIEEDEEML